MRLDEGELRVLDERRGKVARGKYIRDCITSVGVETTDVVGIDIKRLASELLKEISKGGGKIFREGFEGSHIPKFDDETHERVEPNWDQKTVGEMAVKRITGFLDIKQALYRAHCKYYDIELGVVLDNSVNVHYSQIAKERAEVGVLASDIDGLILKRK